MKNLQDAFYNWLSIKVVSNARPNDKAAQETLAYFDAVLKEDYHVEKILQIEEKEDLYYVHYMHQGEKKSMRFPKELVDFMLQAIEKEPHKYPIIE
ncbi:hypothetical protein [Calidifontibacillus erzurumensis]|uniref:Uncharacterized protein n=1 Tax=Calidifontibacillus erzurumensis TaxID=2741433 RepID=A0A8J8GBQ5_9BACI|nr:hypothetical protein [Calidifontibacillus erzurumensis]NSL50732.1 hypothetical protein [Calidifontibacillus erzurumensis]